MKFTLLPIVALATTTLAQSDSTFIPGRFSTNPAQWSSIHNTIESKSLYPSTLTAPPNPTVYGPGQGPWGTGRPTPGTHRYGGPSGEGPWGTGSYGPFVDWSTRSGWRTSGPWTRWWGGSACPGTDWPGWTRGPWSTNPPWTTWTECTYSTTATSVVTTTISGSATTSTAYGIQVAQVGTGTAGAQTGSSGAAMPMRTAGPALAVGAALMGFAAAM